jgi:hypothetical protein
MTSFTLRGRRASQVVTLTWTDGHVWGDPDAITMILRLAQAHEGQPLHLAGGPWTRHHHLRSPNSAYALMQSVFAGCASPASIP